MTTSSAIVPLGKREPVKLAGTLSKERWKEILEENYGGSIRPKFTRVKIPSGGNLSFEIETEAGMESVQAIEGVVLIHHDARAFWAEDFKGNQPPECSSIDGATGSLPRNDAGAYGSCATCKWAQWDTGKGGRGQACKLMHRLYILRPGEILPILLTLPPTSRNAFLNYLTPLTRAGLGLRGVYLRVSLKKEKNQDQIEYSLAQFEALSPLDVDSAKYTRGISKDYEPLTKEVAVSTDDYNVPAEGGGAKESAGTFQGHTIMAADLRYSNEGKAFVRFPFRTDDDVLMNCVTYDALAEEMAEKVLGRYDLEIAGTAQEVEDRETKERYTLWTIRRIVFKGPSAVPEDEAASPLDQKPAPASRGSTIIEGTATVKDVGPELKAKALKVEEKKPAPKAMPKSLDRHVKGVAQADPFLVKDTANLHILTEDGKTIPVVVIGKDAKGFSTMLKKGETLEADGEIVRWPKDSKDPKAVAVKLKPGSWKITTPAPAPAAAAAPETEEPPLDPEDLPF